MIYRKCPLCDGNDMGDIGREPIYTRELGISGPRVNKCMNCNFVFLNPTFDESEAKVYYDADSQRKAVKSVVNTDNLIRDNKRRARWVTQNFPSGNVIDVGSGVGRFVKELQDNRDIVGLEISESRCREAVLNGANVINTNVDDHDGSADIVTIFHVLEHIISPKAFLESIKSIMRKNSVLIVEVPNHKDALVSVNAYKRFYYQQAHCSYFTEDTLKYLLRACGFNFITSAPIQRYSLGNHLHWLINKRPGSFKIPKLLEKQYNNLIEQTKYYDTLFMAFKLR